MQLGIAVVRGRSMLPTYRDGDRLIVLYDGRVVPGRAHLVQLPPGPDGPRPMAVKRVTRRDGDGWWIECDNPGEGVDSWTVDALPAEAVRARVLTRLPRLP
ncbi:S24 family peptidase [Luteipulveratus mongoliensis]|uniref:S24 family peptidase n=1 Tax=Luteipulveratus mongoliensis TaxID=571913 RepID=UPI0009F8CC2A|nr:S24 family peptidase [Luteipulveratus mongoliensis]